MPSRPPGCTHRSQVSCDGLILLPASTATIPDDIKTVLIVLAVFALILLAAFFVYSIFVIVLYWIVLLLPALCFAAGLLLWFQDQMAGNIVLGASVIMALIWVLLVTSKRPNLLRRVLNSLDRSLP